MGEEAGSPFSILFPVATIYLSFASRSEADVWTLELSGLSEKRTKSDRD